MALIKPKSSASYFTLQRICQDVLKGSIQSANAIDQIKQQSTEWPDAAIILSDILHSIDIELEVVPDEEQKKRFEQLCQAAVKEELIPMDVLKMRIDALKGNEEEKRAVTKTLAVARTRLYYKQLKFNLFREESEGYAKVVTELHDETDVHRALEKLRCLIGQFNLDPNRVLDVVLECFECRLDRHQFFANLLRLYNADATDICCLLGFKLSFYQAAKNTIVPMSLYTLIGRLLSAEIVPLPTMCCFLSPGKETLLSEHKKLEELEQQAAAKVQTFNTASTNIDLNGGSNEPSNTMTVGDMASDSTQHTNDDVVLARNQKLGVLCALLECGDMSRADWIMQRLPQYYPFARSGRVVMALSQLIENNIQKLYSICCSEFIVTGDGTKVTREMQTSDSTFNEWTTFVSTVLPRVLCLGPYIGATPALCTQLVRLMIVLDKHRLVDTAKSSKQTTITDFDIKMKELALKAQGAVVDVVDECLVPALSIMNGNASLSEYLWTLMHTWPYTIRYRVYGRLEHVHTKRHAALLMQKNRVLARARYVMKRLSKETTRLAGRQLTKLCHAHAPTVFDHLLNQIQVFDNFIPSVVESLRYLTSLEYDMLSYCIIEHLANPDKQKLKAEDAALSSWLQSLANFIGMVFRKYSLELTGVLQYVANELKDGNSFDLLVLKEIVETMSGVETSTDMTNEQLDALSGGDVLKQEGGRFGDAQKNVKRTTNRLREALLQEDLVVALCLLTAQQRGHIAYKENTNIKLISQMLDQCQVTLVQFGTFLACNLKPEEYRKRMPGAPTLIRDYHLPVDAAMFLARPTYSYLIKTKYEASKKQERVKGEELSSQRKLELFASAFDSIVLPLANELHKALAQTRPYHKIIHPLLVTVFWLLETYDLETPVAAYERAVDKLNKTILELDDDRDLTDKARKREKERLDVLIQKLQDERRKQTTHVAHIHEHLKQLQHEMFGHKSADRFGVQNDYMQACILPRVAFSELDAVYCAKFTFLMHTLQAVQFPTSGIIDRMVCDVSGLVAGFTENEANCYGRLVCAVMCTVNEWHGNGDTAAFEKSVYASPGFTKKFSPEIVVMDYNEFRGLAHKWHAMISRTLQLLLSNAPYLATRNAIFLLIKIMPAFPLIEDHLKSFEIRVRMLRESEKDNREDLCVLANSYYTHLMNRKRTTPMIAPTQFSNQKAKTATAAAPTTSTTAPATTTAVTLTNGASTTSTVTPTTVVAPQSLTRTIRQSATAVNGSSTSTALGHVPVLAASAVSSIKRHVTNGTARTTSTSAVVAAPEEKKRKVAVEEAKAAPELEARLSPNKRKEHERKDRAPSHSKNSPVIVSSSNESVTVREPVLKRSAHAENGESKSKRVRSASKEHRSDTASSLGTAPSRARAADTDSAATKRADRKLKKEKTEKSEKRSREVPRSESRNRDR